MVFWIITNDVFSMLAPYPFEPFPFFKLPPEIRQMVYLLFCGDRCIGEDPLQADKCEYQQLLKWPSGDSTAPRYRKTDLKRKKTKALLKRMQVSKLFYAEAAAVFYASSNMCFWNLNPLRRLADTFANNLSKPNSRNHSHDSIPVYHGMAKNFR